MVVPHWVHSNPNPAPSRGPARLSFSSLPLPRCYPYLPTASPCCLVGELLLAIQDSAQTGTLLSHSHILPSPHPPPLCATSPSYTRLSPAVRLVLSQSYGPSPASPTPLGFLRLKHLLIWVPGSQHTARHMASSVDVSSLSSYQIEPEHLPTPSLPEGSGASGHSPLFSEPASSLPHSCFSAQISCTSTSAPVSSVQFSRSVMSTLRPHGLQHARPPCPSPAPGVYSNSCPLSR